jgi:hypothetical protein
VAVAIVVILSKGCTMKLSKILILIIFEDVRRWFFGRVIARLGKMPWET